MTNEEAIEVLENGAWWDLVGTMPCDREASVKFHNALEAAIFALRGQQAPMKLDRSRWEGCEYCKPDREGYSTCFQDKSGHSIRMYIPEGEAAIVIPGKYNHKSYIKISYCPICGRPLTEEAWSELERRINGG